MNITCIYLQTTQDYILYGNDYYFTVTVANQYKGTYKVFANGNELIAEDGVYKVLNIVDNLTITIDDSDLKIYVPKVEFVKNLCNYPLRRRGECRGSALSTRKSLIR